MSNIIGADDKSVWTRVIRRPETHVVVTYVLERWLKYSSKFGGYSPPLFERDEPTLTEGLAAFLAQEFELGQQPFDGDFFGELRHYDLQPDGKALCVGRTDIEWRLFGFPCFTFEFKILDGTSNKRNRYINDGVQRFVDGRYSGQSPQGAMCAFLRQGSESDAELVEKLITNKAAKLRCRPIAGPFIISPSVIAPDAAKFDTAHMRDEPLYSPIQIIHVFLAFSL